MLWTIIGAIVLGLILGVLARLILPGKQNIPLWLTILVGIAAALIGGFIYSALGGGATSGIDWIKFLVQLVLAVVGVGAVAGFYGKKGVRH
ncbi:MAG: GlsB/YeaQ/YmgE family stress response membrane protein [Pseudonocardia sp.]|jgi:uncharacterized membrane protein YeaQ/YmgE (transglycosylase-associated protein family)